MRIFAGGIATETTFSPIPTSLEDFEVQRAIGEKSTLSSVRIWARQAADRGDRFIFGLMAYAQPAGITTRSAYELLRNELLAALRAAMPLDIVLLDLHGAMAAQGYDDCEQDIIERVRKIAGKDAIVGVELDLHCHLSYAKIKDADIVVTYKEYPHTDVSDRARELFQLAVDARLGLSRPTMALYDCRMIGNYPTTRRPMSDFVASMRAAEKRDGVLSVSFGHGMVYADVPHAGAKVLVVTNGNKDLAADVAREFGTKAHAIRREIAFESIALPMEECFAKALEQKNWPVVIADQSDNPGAGAPGDATYVLRWILDHQLEDAALGILYDPEVVRTSRKADIGSRIALRLGGKLGSTSGDPIDMDALVISTLDNYQHGFPQETGETLYFQAGNVVALRCGSVDIVVSSERCQCFAPSIFEDLGIDPRKKHFLVVKSRQHFYGSFSKLAACTLYMSAPGAAPSNPAMIKYKRMPMGNMYPWNDSPTLD